GMPLCRPLCESEPGRRDERWRRRPRQRLRFGGAKRFSSPVRRRASARRWPSSWPGTGPGWVFSLAGASAWKSWPSASRPAAAGRAAVAQVAGTFGPVDVLIANAGRAMGGRDETNGEAVADVLATNFLGAVYAFETVLPSMLERQAGRVAVVSSAMALLPRLAGSHTYSASKMALSRYFEGLGRELRPAGIAVTVVYPGFVRTEMTAGNRFMPFVLEPD